MSLFDDDFYSTRVPRRVRVQSREGKSLSFGKPLRSGSWSNVRIAMTSSLVSALAAVLVFGIFAGFDRGGGAVATSSNLATIKTGDPLDRTIQAAAKVRPAVVSIINEQAPPSGSAEGEKAGTESESG